MTLGWYDDQIDFPLALPSFSHIQRAARVLQGVAVRTPVLRSPWLDERCGGTVYLKCENLQLTGSFKFRGAYNALVQTETTAPFHRAITLSSGNHAQGVAFASQLLGFSAHIVMPEPVNPFKRARVEGWGAQVSVVPTRQRGQELLEDLARHQRGVFIHPFDDPHVIAGQATVTWEFLEKVPDLDVVLTPIGGGGLLSGACLAAHGHRPGIQVMGCEPSRALDALPSLNQGRILRPDPADTMAEGLRTSLGHLTFAILRDHVSDILIVEEEEIVSGIKAAFENLKMVVEPSASVVLGPILRGEPRLRGQRVGAILSGGNIGLSDFLAIINSQVGE